MKEIIVVKNKAFLNKTDFVCIEDIVKDLKVEYTKERVPETWAELKKLVREKVYDDNRNGVKIGQFVKIEYILIDGKTFMPDGEILDEDNDVFAVNRTPAQMYQIIKSLIGEE